MSKNKLDQFTIKRVFEIRTEQGIGGEELSKRAGFYKNLVGNAEQENRPEKYNTKHLNGFAWVLNVPFSTFFPDKPFNPKDL